MMYIIIIIISYNYDKHALVQASWVFVFYFFAVGKNRVDVYNKYTQQ